MWFVLWFVLCSGESLPQGERLHLGFHCDRIAGLDSTPTLSKDRSMYEENWGEMPKGDTTEHYLELLTVENSNSLSLVSDEQLAQVKVWIEEGEEDEIFEAFDCGPGPCGAGNEELPGKLISEGDEPTYEEGAIYVETLEWADDAQLCLFVTLTTGEAFDPDALIFVTDSRYSDVVVEVRYPGAHIYWTVDSQADLNREWHFYRCEKGKLVWLDIEAHFNGE